MYFVYCPVQIAVKLRGAAGRLKPAAVAVASNDMQPSQLHDLGFGYFLYDTATLLDRIEWREDYPSLRAALLEGYRKRGQLFIQRRAILGPFLVRPPSLASRFSARPNTHPSGPMLPAS